MEDDRHNPRTGRVRIVGANPAGEAGRHDPARPGAGDGYDEPDDDLVDEQDAADEDTTELPHWTEAPTGQVPAVLSRRHEDDDDPWGSLPAPTWREEHTDWAAHEESFDPSVLAADDPGEAPERQPWAFDLDPLAKTTAVPAVRGGRHPGTEPDLGTDLGTDDDGGDVSGDVSGGEDYDEGDGGGYAYGGGGYGYGDDEVTDEHPIPAMLDDSEIGADAEAGGDVDAGVGTVAAGEGMEATAEEAGTPGMDRADELDDLDERPPAAGGWRRSGGSVRVLPSSRTGAGAPGVGGSHDEPDEDDEAYGHGRQGAGPIAVDDAGAGSGAGPDAGGGEPSILDLPPREEELPRTRRGAARRRGGGLLAGLDAGRGAADAAGAAGAAGAGPVPRGGTTAARGGAGRPIRSVRPGINGAVRPLGDGGGPGAGPVGARDGHQRAGRNIPVAVASGVAVGAVALLCFYFGTISSMVVATLAVGFAALEGYAAFRKAGYRPVTLFGLAAVIGVMVGAYNNGEAAEPLVVVLLVAFTLLWHLLRVDKGADPVRSTVATLFVYAWVGVFGSYAALLLSPTNFPHRHGIAYLVGAVITVVAYDVAALGVGSWVGHRPLSSVSPNKTWEGLIGGTVVAMVVAVMLVHLIHPWTVGKAAGLGIIVVVLAPLGDLAESLVKRHVGLKDMGRLLPGHGGLLDRIDGLLFVLPATYYLVRAFHLG